MELGDSTSTDVAKTDVKMCLTRSSKLKQRSQSVHNFRQSAPVNYKIEGNHCSLSLLRWPLIPEAGGGGGGGGKGTPLYGLYRFVRPQRLWIFSRFRHKWVSILAILVINRVGKIADFGHK